MEVAAKGRKWRAPPPHYIRITTQFGVQLTPLLALLGLLGLAGREVGVFERAAAADIATRLEGGQVTVKVGMNPFDAPFGRLDSATIAASNFTVQGLPLFTEPLRSKAGKVGTLKIRLTDFKLRGLQVQELSADIRDCRFDLGLALRERKVRLSRSGSGPGFVRVTAKALEDYILLKYREIKKVKVWFRSRKLFVEGFGDFGFFSADFYVIADLVPATPTQLNLAHAIVFLDGVRVRDGSDQALLDALNPVIDENEDLHLYGALMMERVTIRPDYLELAGTATIPEKPER